MDEIPPPAPELPYPGAPPGALAGSGWRPPPAAAPPWVGAGLAGWWSRVAAYVIDALIVLVPGAALLLGVVAGGVSIGLLDDGTLDDPALGNILALIGAVLLVLAVLLAVYLLYAPALMARGGRRNGQTLGKQMLGIRVVRTDGRPMGFGHAATREVLIKFLALGIASSVVPIVPLFLNFFWPLWDDESRALHDMASSTRVVRS